LQFENLPPATIASFLFFHSLHVPLDYIVSMKVKVLHLDPTEYAVKRPGDQVPLVRNPQAKPTTNSKQKEYMRALAAAKMERMFSKPFVASLDGHTDSVEVIARSRSLLAPIFTGGADGCLNFWDLPHRKLVATQPNAHTGFIKGIVVSNDNSIVYTCGSSDKTIRAWRFDADKFVHQDNQNDESDNESSLSVSHVKSVDWTSGFTSIDHHWSKTSEIVTTCTHTVDVWDIFHSNSPLQSYQWGDDGIITAKFNPSETNLIAVTMKDNSVGLFDTRTSSGIQKVYLKNKSNSVAWNPRNPFNFALGNDDGNVYQMDMRKMGAAVGNPIIRMHTGHVLGVVDVDFNPRGTEIVSGGYDKTVRIFDLDKQKSREIYHTRRMQRILTCKFSGDGRFVLSGSDDTNIRVWKAVANEKLGVIDGREQRAINYRKSLLERYGKTEEIGHIVNHRHVPKWVKNEGKRRSDKFESRKIADRNRKIVSHTEVQHPLQNPLLRQEQ
jgi:WD repeat and SOF domain-containing protein 1